jgi:thiamine biosynthesis lipoprotein ApbE
MNLLQTDLENAIRHVKETEARVAEQQARIARLRRHGQPTQAAEDLLSVLQKALELMKSHLGTLTQPDEPS